ncbi:MAG: zf-HC2 domain-containing protein [Chloroflexi bacterium]|nr:zf-HC2 domain-containing protein [Chloroflexota bacterium]
MNGHNSVSHSWVAERLSEYIDNRLDPRAHAQLEQHLNACDACQNDLASLRWTISLVKHAPAPALPRSFVLPIPARRASSFGFNFATMRLATVVATLLLFIVVASDFVTNFSNRMIPAATRAPVMQELAAPTSIALAPPPAPAATSAPAPTSAPPTKAAEATKPAIAPAAPAAKPPAPTFAPAVGATAQDAAATITPSRDNQKSAASPTLSARVFSTEPVTITIAPTQVPPTATLAPSPTATATSAPSATALPTRIAEARAQPTRAPQPTARDQTAPPIEPFRIAEIGLFFFVVFFGALAILLRAKK